jgi:squalene-hopene/tetraprenyl-beta-curcumene cyclase
MYARLLALLLLTGLAASAVAAEHGSTYLDDRMAAWLRDPPRVGNRVRCAMTCHTALPFAAVADRSNPVLPDLVARLDARVASTTDWPKATPFYGADGSKTARAALGTEAVLNAAALALVDQRAGTFRPETRQAFDHLFRVQRADGAFDWLDFGLEPWESGHELFGAAMAALALGVAPEERGRWQQQADRLATFIRKNEPTARLQERAAVLYAATELDDLLDADRRGAIVTAIAAVQRSDGGFAWADLGIGSSTKSDGYATAWLAFVGCAAHRHGDGGRETTTRALAWLRAARRDDGVIPARSPNRDAARSHSMFTDAATAWGGAALRLCGSR